MSLLVTGIDPYSMLVPFLIFAIGVSHGVQIINAVAHEAMQGADKLMSARRTFRKLYIPWPYRSDYRRSSVLPPC